MAQHLNIRNQLDLQQKQFQQQQQQQQYQAVLRNSCPSVGTHRSHLSREYQDAVHPNQQNHSKSYQVINSQQVHVPVVYRKEVLQPQQVGNFNETQDCRSHYESCVRGELEEEDNEEEDNEEENNECDDDSNVVEKDGDEHEDASSESGVDDEDAEYKDQEQLEDQDCMNNQEAGGDDDDDDESLEEEIFEKATGPGNCSGMKATCATTNAPAQAPAQLVCYKNGPSEVSTLEESYVASCALNGTMDSDVQYADSVRKITRRSGWKSFKMLLEKDYKYDSEFAEYMLEHMGLADKINSDMEQEMQWNRAKKYVMEGMQSARNAATQNIKKAFIGKIVEKIGNTNPKLALTSV
jgi:hypothetical protein